MPIYRTHTRFWTPDDADLALAAILGLLASAAAQIRICAYGFTDPRITGALVERHQAGVDTALLLDYTQACGPSEIAQVRRLKDAGVPFWVGTSEKAHAIRHSKNIIVDSEWAEIGSLNYSATAFDQDNTVEIVRDKELAQEALRLWNKSKQWILDNQSDKQTDYLVKHFAAAPVSVPSGLDLDPNRFPNPAPDKAFPDF